MSIQEPLQGLLASLEAATECDVLTWHSSIDARTMTLRIITPDGREAEHCTMDESQKGYARAESLFVTAGGNVRRAEGLIQELVDEINQKMARRSAPKTVGVSEA